MSATWPASLPQSPLIEGYSDVPQDSVLRFNMDGFTKQRNRYTAVIHDVTEFYLLTPAQFNTFLTFYKNTLSNGSKDFIKKEPVSQLDKVYRFSAPYSFEFNGVSYRVELTMEILP